MSSSEDIQNERRELGKIATFEANHGRDGVIAVITAECHVCGAINKVLAIDTSVSCGVTEYGWGCICKSCFEEAMG